MYTWRLGLNAFADLLDFILLVLFCWKHQMGGVGQRNGHQIVKGSGSSSGKLGLICNN